MWKGPVYDCQQCGACCTNQEYDPAVGYVCLTRDESKQMRRLGLTVVRAGGRSFLGDPRPRRRQQFQMRRFARQSRRAPAAVPSTGPGL